jgi:hypothetical protein
MAAVTQALGTIFDPDLTANLNAIDSPSWVPSHVAFAVAYTLALPRLVALYLRQAARLDWLGETDRPLHFMQPLVAFTALTYFPGFVLTGVAAMRAAVISRWPAWFLVMGALGTLGALGGPGSVARAITIGGSLLLGVAFTWIGKELVRIGEQA